MSYTKEAIALWTGCDWTEDYVLTGRRIVVAPFLGAESSCELAQKLNSGILLFPNKSSCWETVL